MSHIKRVKVFSDQLEIGMFVSDLDRSWSETSFLLQGFTLEDQEDVASVKEQCDFVYVDFPNESLYKKFRARSTVSPTLKKKYEQEINSSDLHDEIGPAAKTFKKSKQVIKSVLDRVMLGEDFEIAAVKEQVKDCVQSIIRNESAMLMMTLIKNKDEYTAEHCLNVGILSIAFARYLGLEEQQLEDIGVAGMLHDVGKVMVPTAILNKPGKLSDEEMATMRSHAQKGYEILLKKRDALPSTVDVAFTHHERLNGEGYPRGLYDHQISTFSRLVSIVDTFDAITSDRCYDQSRAIMDAYKVLMSCRDTHYDGKMVTKFIEWRGIYPPGSIVEMENGEVGIVTATNPRYKLRPKVLLILDENKKHRRRERLIDMSKLDLDASAHTYRIIKAVPNRAFGIDLQEFVDKGLKIAAV
ncbi:HD-GYP domain-containing protein [Pleionea sediminis]|uniref:HD-GYP domain-containing protein n=1 Tax=Pleionea sediminis TaxID=2569479 RepID=UPI00118575CA|nr:HD-GYP domain-containing protein [Pleionea sediminis]